MMSPMPDWPAPFADVHAASRQAYGLRRVHGELPLGSRRRVGATRVWRCMKVLVLQGIHRRR
jgi:putative transposase